MKSQPMGVLLFALLFLIEIPGRMLGQNPPSETSQNAAAHLARARDLEQKGEINAAIEEYNVALSIDPASADTQHHVGALLEKVGKRELAFEHYAAAVELMQKSGRIRTLAGHANVVRAVAFLPASGEVVTASEDGTVKLWDATTGVLERTLTAGVPLRSLAVSGEGLIAAGAADGTVKIWDAGSGGSTGSLKGHTRAVTALSFSPDGKSLASGSKDGTIIVWDVATSAARQKLPGHGYGVAAVAFSPDGKTLASSSFDVRLWDVGTGEITQTLSRQSTTITALAWLHDGKWLATGSEDKTARIWDVAKGELVQTFASRDFPVSSVAISPDRKTLATGGWENCVRLFDLASGELVWTLPIHSALVGSLAFSPDGKLLASASNDMTAKIWRVD